MQSIEQLRHEQEQGVTSVADSLRSVDINLIEICNRTCSFCPRADPSLYANSKGQMSLEVIKKIQQDLTQINFTGRVGFTGFGEPLLHKNITLFVETLSKVPNLKFLEINTNGDFLTRSNVLELADAGLTNLTVSMYDKDETEKFTEIVEGIDVTLTLRHYYSVENVPLVNRIEILKNVKSLNINRICNMPFYKMMIDYNGDVLICNNDWGRVSNMGNVTESTIDEIWMNDKFKHYRTVLLSNSRQLDPCNRCDIDGKTYGNKSVEVFRDYYASPQKG